MRKHLTLAAYGVLGDASPPSIADKFPEEEKL
jgi:hypothetical protein